MFLNMLLTYEKVVGNLVRLESIRLRQGQRRIFNRNQPIIGYDGMDLLGYVFAFRLKILGLLLVIWPIRIVMLYDLFRDSRKGQCCSHTQCNNYQRRCLHFFILLFKRFSRLSRRLDYDLKGIHIPFLRTLLVVFASSQIDV